MSVDMHNEINFWLVHALFQAKHQTNYSTYVPASCSHKAPIWGSTGMHRGVRSAKVFMCRM